MFLDKARLKPGGCPNVGIALGEKALRHTALVQMDLTASLRVLHPWGSLGEQCTPGGVGELPKPVSLAKLACLYESSKP